ncbi:hypothetical protein NC661_03560 [Aquibacillus koreensis]|uniref:DUF4083 domain-containing protein n=1 Tax=Aquibacillus koreensis TaxID=279446 RepID=A0A9X4AH82_9BACI|nr:hypothetical protein [Aquibacillus koreensis]MCT2536473.1 hypothetical protein [Aquibacillus koreensis]MDC3419439.1 hypothetical protein [Aquibacillus koreensis]
MILASSVGGIHIGDIIFSLFSFLFLVAIVVGIVWFVIISKKKNNRLERVEEKLDKLLNEKEN